MSVHKDFLVERQGKTFVLYAGLLDLAHQKGLTGITTQIVQVPSTDNNNTAICTATVSLQEGELTKVFTGIGDAAPNNVTKPMITCLLRMSETRAKSRALRDAVNVGVAALEELGDEDEHTAPPQRSAPKPPPAPALPATLDEARKHFRSIMKNYDLDYNNMDAITQLLSALTSIDAKEIDTKDYDTFMLAISEPKERWEFCAELVKTGLVAGKDHTAEAIAK